MADSLNKKKMLQLIVPNSLGSGVLGGIRTDLDAPLTNRIQLVCPSTHSIWVRKIKENPNYWKEHHITTVLMITDEEFATINRQNIEKYGQDLDNIKHIDEFLTPVNAAPKLYKNLTTGQLISPNQLPEGSTVIGDIKDEDEYKEVKDRVEKRLL